MECYCCGRRGVRHTDENGPCKLTALGYWAFWYPPRAVRQTKFLFRTLECAPTQLLRSDTPRSVDRRAQQRILNAPNPRVDSENSSKDVARLAYVFAACSGATEQDSDPLSMDVALGRFRIRHSW